MLASAQTGKSKLEEFKDFDLKGADSIPLSITIFSPSNVFSYRALAKSGGH